MTDQRVERLADQLLAEGYVDSREEALIAAREVLPRASAHPEAGDTYRA